jgi:hypothetical protein
MDERWVDVSHEALIRGWPRLREWIDKDRAGLQLHHRLNEAAQDWQQADHDANLLYRGARLTQAMEWRERNATELNALEREFLDASVALREQERALQERQRRRIIWGLSVGLLLALSLAGAAGWQWWRAEQQRRLALARQLAQGAELAYSKNTGSDTVSSVLLAVASLKTAETQEAHDSLDRLTSLL